LRVAWISAVRRCLASECVHTVPSKQHSWSPSGIESYPEAADVVEDEQNGKQVEAFFEQLSERQATVSKHF